MWLAGGQTSGLLLPAPSPLLRTAFLLLLLVSATWLLGLLAVNGDSLSFHYLFAAFSCLQVGAPEPLGLPEPAWAPRAAPEEGACGPSLPVPSLPSPRPTVTLPRTGSLLLPPPPPPSWPESHCVPRRSDHLWLPEGCLASLFIAQCQGPQRLQPGAGPSMSPTSLVPCAGQLFLGLPCLIKRTAGLGHLLGPTGRVLCALRPTPWGQLFLCGSRAHQGDVRLLPRASLCSSSTACSTGRSGST